MSSDRGPHFRVSQTEKTTGGCEFIKAKQIIFGKTITLDILYTLLLSNNTVPFCKDHMVNCECFRFFRPCNLSKCHLMLPVKCQTSLWSHMPHVSHNRLQAHIQLFFWPINNSACPTFFFHFPIIGFSWIYLTIWKENVYCYFHFITTLKKIAGFLQVHFLGQRGFADKFRNPWTGLWKCHSSCSTSSPAINI